MAACHSLSSCPPPHSGVYLAGGGTWNQYGTVTITTNSTGSLGCGACATGPIALCRRWVGGLWGVQHCEACMAACHSPSCWPFPPCRCVFSRWWNMEPKWRCHHHHHYHSIIRLWYVCGGATALRRCRGGTVKCAWLLTPHHHVGPLSPSTQACFLIKAATVEHGTKMAQPPSPAAARDHHSSVVRAQQVQCTARWAAAVEV
jgi:hypothetical protein